VIGTTGHSDAAVLHGAVSVCLLSSVLHTYSVLHNVGSSSRPLKSNVAVCSDSGTTDHLLLFQEPLLSRCCCATFNRVKLMAECSAVCTIGLKPLLQLLV
jgi:hypothetical protein